MAITRALHPHLVSLLDHLLPAHCTLCGLYCGSGRLCQPCFEELPRTSQPCRSCALPGLQSDVMICGRCLVRAPAWDEAVASLVYEYPVDQIVQRFKFQRSMVCGQLLADELVLSVSRSTTTHPDFLLPVPLHVTRRFWRGFNQAEFLARQLGRKLDIPVLVNRLRRTKRTRAQSGLDRVGRRKNIRGAFACRNLHGARVALVDDVLTTGTTLTECARAIRAAGASYIAVWVAARVPEANPP